MEINFGDIYYADLGKGFGSEQGGIRPVLIIQNNVGNKYSPTTIIAPLTSKCNSKHKLPTHISLYDKFLPKNSMVLLEQIRVIDKTRLIEKWGEIDIYEYGRIRQGIKISLNI